MFIVRPYKNLKSIREWSKSKDFGELYNDKITFQI